MYEVTELIKLADASKKWPAPRHGHAVEGGVDVVPFLPRGLGRGAGILPPEKRRTDRRDDRTLSTSHHGCRQAEEYRERDRCRGKISPGIYRAPSGKVFPGDVVLPKPTILATLIQSAA